MAATHRGATHAHVLHSAFSSSDAVTDAATNLLTHDASRSIRKRSVLMLDPDADVAGMLSRMLDDEGYSTRHASSFEDGWEALINDPPDLIMVDLRLVDRTSRSPMDFSNRSLQWLRHRAAAMPILAIDSEWTAEREIDALDWGADSFVARPFNPKLLLAKIRALLRRAGGSNGNGRAPKVSDRLVAGPIAVDYATRQVWCNEKTVDLTPTEFKLLTFLMEEGGRVLTFGQIIRAVWGYENGTGDDSLVRIHISRLRKKLEKAASAQSTKIIVSHPRIGYSIALNHVSAA